MAHTITEFPNVLSGRRDRGKYDKFMDGQVWVIDPKEVDVSNIPSLRMSLALKVKGQGRTYRSCTRDGKLVFQALDKE